jgi:hypothetical protein
VAAFFAALLGFFMGGISHHAPVVHTFGAAGGIINVAPVTPIGKMKPAGAAAGGIIN